jgi:hypothetical protein
MPNADLNRAPQFVGVVTLAAGAALLASPRAVAGWAHLGDRPDLARVIGVMDLVLVPGLLRARSRWRWMLARAAFNLPVIAGFRAQAAQPGGDAVARVGMVTMVALSAMDLVTAVRLRRAETATTR